MLLTIGLFRLGVFITALHLALRRFLRPGTPRDFQRILRQANFVGCGDDFMEGRIPLGLRRDQKSLAPQGVLHFVRIDVDSRNLVPGTIPYFEGWWGISGRSFLLAIGINPLLAELIPLVEGVGKRDFAFLHLRREREWREPGLLRAARLHFQPQQRRGPGGMGGSENGMFETPHRFRGGQDLLKPGPQSPRNAAFASDFLDVSDRLIHPGMIIFHYPPSRTAASTSASSPKSASRTSCSPSMRQKVGTGPESSS